MNCLRFLFLTAVLMSFPVLGMAQQPESISNLAVKLQASPADTSLREQIIKLANETKPPPPIPESARGHFVEGNALAKAAKDTLGQKLAVESFKEALKIAPWWGDAYYNLAIAQELAGQFEEAQSSLKFYILTNPGEKEAREAQDKIYALNAKKKLAEAEAAQKQAAKKATEDTPEARNERLLSGLEGAIYCKQAQYDPSPWLTRNQHWRDCVLVRNRELIIVQAWWSSGQNEPGLEQYNEEWARVGLSGRSVTYKERASLPTCSPATMTFSDDGRTIAKSVTCSGRSQVEIYFRRR